MIIIEQKSNIPPINDNTNPHAFGLEYSFHGLFSKVKYLMILKVELKLGLYE
jgi:hypothetical protein